MFGDCHIHMILDGVYYRAAIDHQKNQIDEALLRARLAAYRAADIHFLRDGGDAWNVGATAAKLAPEYDLDYRTPVFPIHRKGCYGGFIGRGYSNLAEYRLLVQEAGERGADFIKIMISGLMDFNQFGTITGTPLPAEEIRELIHIAHEDGFAVMAHANGAQTIAAAIDAGVDSIEHGAYMDADTVHALAESRCVWTPTLVTVGNLLGEGRYPDAVLSPLLQLQMENVALCAQLGGKIALGSDAGAYAVYHVQGAADEYALLKRAVGERVDSLLAAGENEIRSRFRRH